jgi:hypothetical protein
MPVTGLQVEISLSLRERAREREYIYGSNLY